MKSGHIIMAALILASIGVVSGASDDEVMLFAKGVLASDYEKHTANILGDNLSIEGVSDEYGEKSVESVGSRLMRMSSLAKKIIDAYPGRFKQLDLILYDSTGRSVIGTMNIIIEPVQR